MLKEPNLMKEAEARAGEALRQLLEEVPIVKVESIEYEVASPEWEPDVIARVLADGRRHMLVCEFKSNGQPRYARTALLQLRDYVDRRVPAASPVFMAPFISPAVRRLCAEKNVNYLDLTGNARITFGGVFIERVLAETPVAEQRELKSIFRPKSAQVLRVMLREPGRAWRVTELAETSGVSLGHVSNVRNNLINREWAIAANDGLVLSQPDALLNEWRDAYRAPMGECMRFYTSLHGRALEDAARSVLGTHGGPGQAAFASFSAAQWLAPYGRTGTHYFFADRYGLQKLQSVLKLSSAAKGENVIVFLPKDAGLFTDVVEPAPGAVCTSPIQTYLDLSIAGERGVEAAEHLRQERLSWPT
jgi:hypothetical protein